MVSSKEAPVLVFLSSFPTERKPHEDKCVKNGLYVDEVLPVPFANITTGYLLSPLSSSEGYQTAYFPMTSPSASYSL